MHSDILTFPTIDELGEAFAGQLAGRVRESKSDRFRLALSGGRTPEPLLRRLADPAIRAAAPWDKVEVYYIDERAVGPDDPQSNYGMTRRAWLGRGAVPGGQIHRMIGESPDLAAEAQRYERLLTQNVPAGPSGFPALDLILLGLGEDGHVASLFPGTEPLNETLRLVTVNTMPRTGQRRLTLTLPVLNAAREIWLVACGESKAGVIAQALGSATDLANPLPVMLVHPIPGHLQWWLDRAAAKNL